MEILTRNGLKKFIGMKTLKIIFLYLEYVVLCKYEWYDLSDTSDQLVSGNAHQVQFQDILH